MKLHHYAAGFMLLLLAACSRNSGSGPMPPPSGLQAQMTGKWTINYVISYFFDSTGAPFGAGSSVYVCPAGYYCQVNAGNSWSESFFPDTLSVSGMNGTYMVTGNSSFTLVNPAAPAMRESCKVDTLSTTCSSFSMTRGHILTALRRAIFAIGSI